MRKNIETVYIVDDDPIIVYSMKRLMNEIDFCKNLFVFDNGKIAIQKLEEAVTNKKDIPDILFLDLTMPIMNGWEFLDYVQKLDSSILNRTRIIVISSSVNPSDIERINSYSLVERYIVKPVTPSDLETLYKD